MPKKRVLTKFNRNTFVTVRIRLFCSRVISTSELPTTERKKIAAYRGTIKSVSKLAPFLATTFTGTAAVAFAIISSGTKQSAKVLSAITRPSLWRAISGSLT